MPLEKVLRAALVDGIHYLPGDPIDRSALKPGVVADLLLHEVLAKPDLDSVLYRRPPVYAFGKPPAQPATPLEHRIAAEEADEGYRAPDGTPMPAMPVGAASQTPGPATPPLDGPGGPALVRTAPDNPAAGGAERQVLPAAAAIEVNRATGELAPLGQAAAEPTAEQIVAMLEAPVVPPAGPTSRRARAAAAEAP